MWSSEARERQRQAIRQWQPWRHATGPKTSEGKARSSRNALKSGRYCKAWVDAERARKHEAKTRGKAYAALYFLELLSRQLGE